MPVDKNNINKDNKDSEKKIGSIPSKIIEAISSVVSEDLIPNESCPSFSIKKLNITDSICNLNKKKIEKEYKIGNYLIKKTLGQGTFGKVKLGVYLPNKEKVAIKILEKNRIVEKDDEIRVKREFDMLALFNHPNVILVAEIFESSDSYYSVMEYCQGGELFNYIVKNRRLSDEEGAFFYFQLINGLEYLHSLGIVHRDLKPENLLLTNEHLLKIIDFGLSNYFKEGQKNLLSTPCGSPCYASPEMVAGKKYDGFKIDIWSTGIILYAMLCGYLPFEDKDNDILFEKILECKLVFPKYISKNAKDLIKKILVTDPDKRITIPEIKRHPFYLSGKELFEQDFSIYQISKNNDEKNSSFDQNDFNNIIDIQDLKVNQELNILEDKENLDNNILNNKNNKEKSDKDNGREIKEIEIKLTNKNSGKITGSNSNKNTSEKNEDYNIHKKMKTSELKTTAQTIENSDKIISKNSNKEKESHINTSQSKGKNEKNKKLSFMKESSNKGRKRLIKNARKLNIKNGSHRFKTSKKLNDLIKYDNLKNHLFQPNKLDIFANLKPEKFLDKNLINKKVKLIQINFNSKDNLNSKTNNNSENTYLSKINNNTIDNSDMNTKKNYKINFQKLNFISIQKNKKAKSISKNSKQLTLFEASKIKKIQNRKNRIYQINTSIKKNKKNVFNLSNNIKMNNWNMIRYNLLHKKNLKEINIKFQKAKKMILSNEGKSEIKNNNNKMTNTNSITIDTTLNNNNHMNIVENPENLVNKTKIKNKIIKLNKKSINKKLPFKTEKIKKEKLFMRTIDKERNEHTMIKTSVNLNPYLPNVVEKKTIEIEDKKHKNILSTINSSKKNEENNIKKQSIKTIKKDIKNNLNINIDNKNQKKYLSNLIDRTDNLESIDNILKTEPNQNKYTKILNSHDKKNINTNKSNNKHKKENKNKNNYLLQIKFPLFIPDKKNKVNYIKKQSNENVINNTKFPKNLNRTSNNNFQTFIQNPFTSNNPNGITKLFIHTNNGSFNQSEQNLSKKSNEKNNLNNFNNISKKKPLVSIRNTVINFNMIDSGFILDPLKRKKNGKKILSNNLAQNYSVNKIQNNHLFGLCNKFNFNNNNNLILNNDYHLKKTKTINSQNNSNNNNKIFRYGDKMNNKLSKKKYVNNHDKNHVKYNSMKLDDHYGLKKKKNLKNINTNKINNTINNTNKIMNIDLNHFNTINN